MSSRPSAERSTSDGSVRAILTTSPNFYSPISNTSQALNSSTDSSAELQQVVDELLTQLQSKFTNVSSEILAKSKMSSPENGMNDVNSGCGSG